MANLKIGCRTPVGNNVAKGGDMNLEHLAVFLLVGGERGKGREGNTIFFSLPFPARFVSVSERKKKN